MTAPAVGSNSIVERVGRLRLERAQRGAILPARAAEVGFYARRAATLRATRSAFYKGAEDSRLTADFPFFINDRVDREILTGLVKLRGRARRLSDNSNPIKQFKRLLTNNVIGPRGFKLRHRQPIVDAWNAFCQSRVTVDRKWTFNQLARLSLATCATDGESVVRMYRGFANRWRFGLQTIDPAQLDEAYSLPRSAQQNEVRLGVEVDALGAPQAYHIYEEPSALWSTRGRRLRIDAAEIVHAYDPFRVNQTRGITWLVSAMFPTMMLEGYKENELVAARVAASKMGFFQAREGLTGEMLGEPTLDEDGKPREPEELVMEAAPGTFEKLPPGYEFNAWNPDHPSTAFGDFVKSVLRDIASGLGVGYNALASDMESTSYSSARFANLIDRDQWQALQEWWVACWLQPIFDAWLETALLAGAIPGVPSLIDTDYEPARWVGRGWAYTEPLKDVQASSQGVLAGLTSRTRELARQGEEFDDILAELAAEKKAADAAGVDITPKGAAFAPQGSGGDYGGSDTGADGTGKAGDGSGEGD